MSARISRSLLLSTISSGPITARFFLNFLQREHDFCFHCGLQYPTVLCLIFLSAFVFNESPKREVYPTVRILLLKGVLETSCPFLFGGKEAKAT